MKRTFTSNIDGQIFNIDEDAYNLLLNYLEQLRHTFGGKEGEEICGDIESRIREHFNERIVKGANVIVIEDVNRVIATMGTPEAISGEAFAEAGESGAAVPPPIADASQSKPRKHLFRNIRSKVFGGVFSGLGAYLGWNANIMRLFYILITIFFPYHFLPVLAYLIAWMVIKPATTPQDMLEMSGEPVNVETLGQAIIDSSREKMQSPGFWSGLFAGIGKCIMAFLGLISATATISFLAVFVVLCTALVTYIVSPDIPTVCDFNFGVPENITLKIATALVWDLFALLLSLAVTWAAASTLFKTKPLGRSTLTIGAVMTLLLFIAGLVLGFLCF